MTSLAELADTFRTIADEAGREVVKSTSPLSALAMGRYLAYRDAQRLVERAMRERCIVSPPFIVKPHRTCRLAPGECDCRCETCLEHERGVKQ